jgi:2-amino-4-hydroxy-6-hydroxymethyldihydropteridine diphosphokinase
MPELLAGMASHPAEAFIALGANLGDPAGQIEKALGELADLPDTRLVSRSSPYLSQPVGYGEQPDYVNAVACLSTTLPPRALLAALLEIERRHGRERTFRNAPRTLDLDILLYGGLVMDEPGLHLPHPRLHERAFVLLPLAEIAPHAQVPGRGRVDDLLARVDSRAVTRLTASPSQASPR